MIKWLICRLWGHKTVVKGYTGQTYQTTSYGGNPLSVSLYTLDRKPFCVRCGCDVHTPDTTKK